MSSSSRAGPVASPNRMLIDSRKRWLPDLHELYRYRQLVAMLGRRDITVRYRQTILGAVWLFAGALVTAGLFAFVFGKIAGLPTNGVPYFVFSYAGLVGWNLFSSVLTGTAGCMTPNSGLFTKIYFPRLALPVSGLVAIAVNTAFSIVIMALLLVIYGIAITVQVLLLPVWLLLTTALALGIGLALTAYAVEFRDVGFITPIFVQLLLYLSPVAYSLEAVPAHLRNLYLLNPIATLIEGCRWSLLGGSYLPPTWAIVYTVVLSIVTLLLGSIVFVRREYGFADVV